MNGADVRLSAMCDEHRRDFDEMLEEYRAAGEVGLYTGFYAAAWEGFDAYRATLARLCAGGWPHREVVPGEAHFLVDGARIVGEVYLRLGLTPALVSDGGNIGYQVRPSERNKGYATHALRLALRRLGELGLAEALVTCDEHNAASIRVVEKNGGARIDDALLEDGSRNRRYLLGTQSGVSEDRPARPSS